MVKRHIVISYGVGKRIKKGYEGAQPVLFGNMAFGAVDSTTKRKKRKIHHHTSLSIW